MLYIYIYIYIFKNIEIFCFLHIQFAPLHRKTLEVLFVTTIPVSIFQCGQPWWLEKYPDDVMDLNRRVLKHDVRSYIRSVACSGI